MRLIESDPALSRPLGDDAATPDPGAGDWFILIDGTDVKAIPAIIAARRDELAAQKATVISSGVYTLMWDLAKSDIGP
jgi:hypothetical protein